MGWASAGDIFDPVAQALIELDADERTKRSVLGPLIDALQEGDWDTEDESLEQFRADPVIVSIFYSRGVGNETDSTGPDYVWSVIDYEPEPDEWTLTCVAGDGTGCGHLRRTAGDEAGHDQLVRAAAAHDKEEHGGSGVADKSMLIGRGGGA